MATINICKTCSGLAPVGIGYAAEGTDAEAKQCAERIACDCGQSRTANAWAVLNCPCTQILGLYSTEEAATAAAEWFGSCSFAYRLSDAERDRLIAA
ncbi:hypothetical protein J4H92_14760 [Leucobacter weissii]|uniref:Uncharacterized protein n=1 Tax=Leucobacter weissii TaxID=1983706 RepID=A0A939MLZ5_9MICO|nr:hypothetical protein [Leucobacter weissii]MBO1903203.1 hypothetical protein [Leucobacter weissii]